MGCEGLSDGLSGNGNECTVHRSKFLFGEVVILVIMECDRSV